MEVQIRVPPNINSGMSLSVGRWFKQVGDAVTKGEPLVEIEGDDVTHELRASATGVLSKILMRDGASVASSVVVGIIAEY